MGAGGGERGRDGERTQGQGREDRGTEGRTRARDKDKERDTQRQKKGGEREAKAKHRMPGVPPAHTHTCTHTLIRSQSTLAQDSGTRVLLLPLLLKCRVTLQNASPPSEPLDPLKPGDMKLVPGRPERRQGWGKYVIGDRKASWVPPSCPEWECTSVIIHRK